MGIRILIIFYQSIQNDSVFCLDSSLSVIESDSDIADNQVSGI